MIYDYKAKGFRNFLIENEISKMDAVDDTAKLTDRTDKAILDLLVRYRKSVDKNFDPRGLKGTSKELKTLYNWARTKADPTSGKPDSKASSIMDKVQKLKDDKASDKDSKEDKETKDTQAKEQEKAKEKGENGDEDSEDTEDSEDNALDDVDIKKEQEQRVEKVTKHDVEKHKEARAQAVKDLVDDMSPGEEKEIKNKFLDVGIKLGKGPIKDVLSAMATMLGIDSEVTKMVDDLVGDAEKLKEFTETTKSNKEDAISQCKKELRDNKDNYEQVIKQINNNLKKEDISSEDKEKLKKLKEDATVKYEENKRIIKDNMMKKVSKYNKILGLEDKKVSIYLKDEKDLKDDDDDTDDDDDDYE